MKCWSKIPGNGVWALESGLIFKIFSRNVFWTHESPIGDFGGRGPSSYVLKQKAQNSVTTPKLLGNLLKDFDGF